MKCCLKFSHVLSASGLSFHFSTASAKIRALLRVVFPMLMSCGSVSSVPWDSANVVYLCILLKIFATSSSWMYWCWSKVARSSWIIWSVMLP